MKILEKVVESSASR